VKLEVAMKMLSWVFCTHGWSRSESPLQLRFLQMCALVESVTNAWLVGTQGLAARLMARRFSAGKHLKRSQTRVRVISPRMSSLVDPVVSLGSGAETSS
jgi:hypothetical protein